MPPILSTEQNDRETWNSFAVSQPSGHLLQSHEWGELKREFGWQTRRLMVENDAQRIAGAQILLRSLPIGAAAYVPRGPILDPQATTAAESLLPALHRISRQASAIFLRIEPPWQDTPTLYEQLKAWDFRPTQSIQPRSTIRLNLERDEEDILMDMKSKTRYNIRLAGRKNVVVRQGDEEDVATFYHLLKTTSERQEFAIHSESYYRKAWRAFSRDNRTVLLLAYYDEEVLGGLMVFAFGDTACYLYGASSNRHRNRMPNYRLQWEAIRWAKGRGCTWYDLWGVPDEVGKAVVAGEEIERGEGGMWGVYRFKRGFGGQVVRYVGAWDYVYRPALYWLLTQYLTWRRIWSWAG